MDPTTITITELFRALEESGIKYAVLRNYDDFPNFSHDVDLVIDTNSLDAWQKLLIDTGQANGWDVITLCDHWSDRKMSHLHIDVYRLYLLNSPTMLQIDIFHGFSVWSLPLFNETELLEDRRADTAGRFTHINQSKETVFRILQINSLIGRDNTQEKIERYSRKVLSHWESNAGTLINTLKLVFGKHTDTIINSIERRDYSLLKQSVTRAKQSYILNGLIHKPGTTIYGAYRRAIGVLRQYIIRPCGFILMIRNPDDALKLRICQSMADLKQDGVLYCWTDRNAGSKWISRKERRMMERGGIVLKWGAGKSSREVDFASNIPTEKIRELIFQKLIRRHEIIYQKEGVAV